MLFKKTVMKNCDPVIKKFTTFDNTAVDHGITTRFTSEGTPFNLGFNTCDPSEVIQHNRTVLYGKLLRGPERFIWANQKHTSRVFVVDISHGGAGAFSCSNAIPEVDALVTACPNLYLCILTADCLPVLLYDPACRVVAAVHAGRRGLAGGIIENTVSVMGNHFGSRPDTILAGIGPGIDKCCYRVDEETGRSFLSQTGVLPADGISGEVHLDLKATCRRLIMEEGIPADRIETMPECTACNNSVFFSYRGDDSKTGRFATYIALV